MDNDKKVEQVLRIAEIGNYKLHSDSLMIPILKGLEVRDVDNAPQVVLFADNDTLCEQLISDGYVEMEEIPERLNSIIETAKSFMKDIGCVDPEKSFLFHKEVTTNHFQFKIYVQDIIFEEESVKKIIRQMNAYFFEPVMNDYYQFSLSSGPYDLESSQIIVGAIDLEHDEETRKLDKLMDILLQNLKYNEKRED